MTDLALVHQILTMDGHVSPGVEYEVRAAKLVAHHRESNVRLLAVEYVSIHGPHIGLPRVDKVLSGWVLGTVDDAALLAARPHIAQAILDAYQGKMPA